MSQKRCKEGMLRLSVISTIILNSCHKKERDMSKVWLYVDESNDGTNW
jgi:hypothetical protein